MILVLTAIALAALVGFAFIDDGPDDDTETDRDAAFGANGDDEETLETGTVFFGGDGDDSLEGTWTPEDGWATSLELHGEGGNDDLRSGDNSTLTGGQGDDHLHSGENSDLSGGSGNDTIYGIASTIDGGAGDDYILNARETGQSHGGEGDDTLGATEGTLWGDEGDDHLSIVAGTAYGGAGNDFVGGSSSFNTPEASDVYGEDGNDTLYINGYGSADGGAGQDTITAEFDETTSEAAHPHLTGGSEGDLFSISGSFGRYDDLQGTIHLATITDFDPAEDALELVMDSQSGHTANLSITNVSTVSTEAGTDVHVDYSYEDNANEINTFVGIIRLDGVESFDTNQISIIQEAYSNDYSFPRQYVELSLPETGTSGDDTFNATTPAYLNTGAGNDHVTSSSDIRIDLGEGDDFFSVSEGNHTVFSGDGNDTIFSDSTAGGLNNLSLIEAGAGDDLVTVSGDNVWVDGGEGDDTLSTERGSGEEVVFRDASEIHMSLGQEGWARNVEINIYPEDLDREHATVSEVSDVTINVPPELSTNQVVEFRHEEPDEGYSYTFITIGGHDVVRVSGYYEFDSDQDRDRLTVNWNVTYP